MNNVFSCFVNQVWRQGLFQAWGFDRNEGRVQGHQMCGRACYLGKSTVFPLHAPHPLTLGFLHFQKDGFCRFLLWSFLLLFFPPVFAGWKGQGHSAYFSKLTFRKRKEKRVTQNAKNDKSDFRHNVTKNVTYNVSHKKTIMKCWFFNIIFNK